jgi:uncharacterized membrane protein YbhN (UPF0104 family)
MKLRALRPILAGIILCLTLAFFIYYFIAHPAVRHQLASTSPQILIAVFFLYILGVIALAIVTLATLRLCKITIGKQESVLLTAYSSIVNFFGPLQSGPAFRAVYLKKRHNVNLKSYAAASIVYYFFYGGISGLLLLYGVLGGWLILLALAGFAIGFMLTKHPLVAKRMGNLDLRGWYYLAGATALQIAIVTVIYFLELHSIAPGTTLKQAVIYSGAANLALFVSLTPGAIGFRESFLLFSQHLHHISSSTIVATNILDRAMYIVLLFALSAFIAATHGRQYLNAGLAKNKH